MAEETKTEIVDDKKKDNKNNSNDSLDELINIMDNLPQWVKIILALPFLDIVWNIYRLLKSISKNNTVGIVVAVIILFVGVPFVWLIDIICIAYNNHVWWLD